MPEDDQKPGKATMAISKAEADKKAAEDREREIRAAEIEELKKQRDEAAGERKQAEADRVATLERELADQKKENMTLHKSKTSQTRWFLGITVSAALLLLLFIGVLVGVIQDGDISVPGLGNVTLAPAGGAEPAPAPDDDE